MTGCIVGWAHTKFGKHDGRDVESLIVEVAQGALADAGIAAADIDAVYLGIGIPAKNPIPPSMWSYNDAVKDYDYDPDGAKKLLADAGLASGFTCTLLSTAQYGMHKMTAEVVQQDLAAVGIQAQLNLPQMPFLGLPLPQQISLPGDLTSLINGGVPASPGVSSPGLVPVPAAAPVTAPNPMLFPVSGLP